MFSLDVLVNYKFQCYSRYNMDKCVCLLWSPSNICRHDKRAPSVLLALQTHTGKFKLVFWIDAASQKIGVRSLSSDGKRNLVFKKLPLKHARWHKIVMHFQKMDSDKPKIDLYVDCQLADKRVFPFSLRFSLIEDQLDTALRLGTLKPEVGKDPIKFVVSICKLTEMFVP